MRGDRPAAQAQTPSDRCSAKPCAPPMAWASFWPPEESSGATGSFRRPSAGLPAWAAFRQFETRSQSVLSSRLPGTTTGPLDPPRASDRELLRFSFPLALSGLWHFRHRAFKSGSTSRVSIGIDAHRQSWAHHGSKPATSAVISTQRSLQPAPCTIAVASCPWIAFTRGHAYSYYR